MARMPMQAETLCCCTLGTLKGCCQVLRLQAELVGWCSRSALTCSLVRWPVRRPIPAMCGTVLTLPHACVHGRTPSPMQVLKVI